jgi:amidase
MSKAQMTLQEEPGTPGSGRQPIHWMDAHDQADLVRRGEVQASELLEISIRRIHEHNPAIGAVIYERLDRALEEAALVDQAAPLAGVPTLVKETTPLTGEPYDLGSPAIAASGRRSPTDDPIVTTMRRAGMIVVGQSMAPEFALASTSENRVHGAARNPWNTGHTSGGSSGGASAAVAAGFVPIGQGGDGGGSIRMPASFCDLVGLKPSRGLIAPKPGGDRWGHSVPAFTTRSVRDTALMMDLLRTDHPGPLGRGTPPDMFRTSISRDPRRLRIGVLTNSTTTGEPVAPEVDAAVTLAAAALEELGHDVSEEHPRRFTNPANITAFFDALSVTATASIDSLASSIGRRLNDDELDPVTALWDRRGRTISGMELAAAFTEIERLRVEMGTWWNQGFDVLVAPVFATPPLEIGWPWREPGGIQRTVDVVRFTAPINSTGQPAIAVPVGFSAKGLPIGVQFIGGIGCDSLLVSLAAQYERARPWHGRHAPGL